MGEAHHEVGEERVLSLTSDLDGVLTAQVAVAWAGEAGESPRLGWWRTDLVSEFGGEDLFRRLAPHTWRWAVLQGVREVARRRDHELRSQDHDPDRIISLYRFGFEIDERVDERFLQLKCSGEQPMDALPGLRDLLGAAWDREAFTDWVEGHGKPNLVKAPVGRRLRGAPPSSLGQLVKQLVAGLAPLADEYSLPHFKVAG